MAVLLLFLALVQAQQLTPLELAHRLDGRFNTLQTLQADFTEDLSGQPTATGVLYLRQPGRMRWDYLTPAPHVFLVDGKQVWQFLPGDPSPVTPTPLSSVDDLHTPLRFLLGHTDLERELAGLGFGGIDPLQPGDWVLHGMPPAPPPGEQSAWRQVWIEVTPNYDIVRVVVEAINGARTDIRFSHIRANEPIPASEFIYRPGAGGLY